MARKSVFAANVAVILVLIAGSLAGCPHPPSGGAGADVDMSNYYTKAEIAALLQWAKTGDNIYNQNVGNVGIGTDAPGTNKLKVNGNLEASSMTINGSPVSASADTYWLNNGGKIYYNAGNVGIGTNNPSEPLEVAVRVRIGAYSLPSSDGSDGYVLKTNGAGSVSWQADREGSGTSGPAGGDLSGTYPNPSIGNLAVGTGKLANLAVETAKIATGAVTADKIGTDAVSSDKLNIVTNIQTGSTSTEVTVSIPSVAENSIIMVQPTGSGQSLRWSINSITRSGTTYTYLITITPVSAGPITYAIRSVSFGT